MGLLNQGNDMNQIKAIQTAYKGYHFRSRLEARWAVFFDTLGIKYQYEPQGFECVSPHNESEIVRYLPDFYLPDSGTWVEVKGGKISAKDARKMGIMLDYGSPLTMFHGSALNHDFSVMKSHGVRFGCERPGLLLLGDIPDPKTSIVLHPIITHFKGLSRKHIFFAPLLQNGAKLVNADYGFKLATSLISGIEIKENSADGWCDSDEELIDFFDCNSISIQSKTAFIKTVKAYEAARSARFEHGQSGATL